MEQLTEKVYECNLAVEAHMVCDLLSQAGISARVDGEFLQSAAGEIPLGNTVKVRVDPARASEAREVIADWEQQQPPDPIVAPVTRSSRWLAPLWFFAGLLVGLVTMFLVMRNSVQIDAWEYDRNDDGRIDARWVPGLSGVPAGYEEDNDYDGRFEVRMDVDQYGYYTHGELDVDGDGRSEQTLHFKAGKLEQIDFHFASGGRIVKRQYFRGWLPVLSEYDDDGDGRFERRVDYDAHGDPKPPAM
ncbi:MAG TPA: DUF2007 domain-containing protein [Steroidobacteraceae bacterium]